MGCCRCWVKAQTPASEHESAAPTTVDAASTLRHSQALAALGRRVVEGADIDDVLDEVVELAANALRASTVSLFDVIVEPDAGAARSLRFRAGSNWHGDPGQIVPLMPDSQATYILDHPEGTIRMDDPGTETRFVPAQLLLDQGVESSVSIRIGRRSEPFALLSLFSDQPAFFTDADMTFMEELSYFLASAIERHRAQEHIRRLSLTDELTGLANRRAFDDRLAERSAIEGAVTAVLLIDLDHFKDINDTFGHQRGDLLLRRIAERLRETLHESIMVARIGGDEFAVVMNLDDAHHDIDRIADGIINHLSVPIAMGIGRVQTSVSIGYAAIEDPSRPAAASSTIIRHADLALYAAKRGGRGQAVRYSADQHSGLAQRTTMAERLEAAINSGSLSVAYQPEVELATGHVRSVEALSRWVDETHGPIGPDIFVTLAEELGLIAEVGRFVLRRALRDLASWNEPELGVAVNLSPFELADPELADRVCDALHEVDVAPARLTLEVTESSFRVGPVGLDSLDRLRALGVSVAIDDFGTSASNIARLHDLPITSMKLDRDFLVRLDGGDHRSQRLLEAVTTIGRALDIEVVAEGIETEAQLETVRNAGCQLGQGYLLARPMAAESVNGWLAGPRADLPLFAGASLDEATNTTGVERRTGV